MLSVLELLGHAVVVAVTTIVYWCCPYPVVTVRITFAVHSGLRGGFDFDLIVALLHARYIYLWSMRPTTGRPLALPMGRSLSAPLYAKLVLLRSAT